MNDALRMGKKALTLWVVGATLLWAMSAAFLVLPLTAKAATLTAGDLIRGTEKSVYGGYPVYYYGTDGKKYLFPTGNTYSTWYADFSSVKVLTQAELEAVPFGGNATYKPGAKLVKFPGDAKVYAVDKGGTLRHVTSEAIAVALYGSEWYKPANLTVIPEGFQANYSMTGAAINAATDYVKSTVMASAPDIGTDKGIGATPTVSGALSAALASDNPSGQVLPAGASGMTVLKVNLTAGASATTITSLTFKAAGVGSADDFTNLYVYDGGTRLTSGRTMTSQTKQVEYSNLSISVPAAGSKMLSLVADVAAGIAAAPPTSGDTHAFSLIGVGTTASVSGLPTSGATMSIGSQDVSTVTVQRGTDPAAPTIGQKAVAVAEFRITSGANDIELRRATITVGGTVSMSDLANFELYQSSTKLAGGTISGDRVTFALDTAFAIAQGANRVFTVKADVAGRSGRTIAAYIDSTYPSDLYVVDKVYGVGTAFTWTSFAAVATASATPATGGSFVTTQGGKVTVAYNGPPSADVSKGTQDVTLYKFSMTAAEQAVEIKKMGVVIAGTAGGFVRGSASTKYFTDIKIKNLDTGTVVMGPKEHTAAASATTTGATPCASAGTLCYTDGWTLDAGRTVNLAITADLANAEDAGADEFFDEGYAVTLEGASTTSIREISTGQYLAVADIVGAGTAVTGNTMTVRSSGLTVAVASTPVSGSTVKGSQGVQVVGFAFTAGASSAVKVTQLVLAGEGSDADPPTAGGTYTDGFTTDGTASVDDLIISASLWDGTTQVGTAKSPSSTGTLTFDNLTWNLGAGETRKLIVKANVTTTLIGTTPDYVYLGLPVANVTSQDSDSNSISATAGTPTPTNPDGVSNFLTINSAGTLTVALDGDSPLSTLVVSNATGVIMTKVKFTAARESYLVNKLRVVNTSTATGTTADSATSDDMVGAVKLSYKKQDGTIGTASGVMANGIANFSGLGFYVGVDKTEVLTISADMADLTAASGRTTTVETPNFGLDFGIAASTNFEAVGVGSSTTLTLGTDVTAGSSFTNDADAEDADVIGNAVYVVKTKPTVSLSASSPSGPKSPSSNLEVLRFTVAANASGDMDFARATLRINATDNGANDWNQPRDAGAAATQAQCEVGGTTPTCATADSAGAGSLEASDFHIYDAAAPDTELGGTWTLWDASGTTLDADEDVGFARFDFDRDDVTDTLHRSISAGTSKTYIVKMNLMGLTTGTNGDRVGLDVMGDTSATLANYDGSPADDAAMGSRFVWGEIGSNAITSTRATPVGITGYLLEQFTVTGNTLTF